jgi:hypothetical protein
MSKFAAEAMIAGKRGGRIINILSTAAFQVASPLIAYGAAKIGLWYVTQAMAQELAEHKILVNAVTPGATMTAERIEAMAGGNMVEKTLGSNTSDSMKKLENMLQGDGISKAIAKIVPLGRPGFPDDLANAVLFLASDMAKYISGVNITVDGGQTLKNDKFAAANDMDDNEDSAVTESVGTLDKSLEGVFKAMVKTPMGSQEVFYTFHVDGAVLTGNVTVLGNTLEIENGKSTAEGFSFQYKMKGPIGKIKVTATGKLEGDKIVCNLKTPMGSIPFEGIRE